MDMHRLSFTHSESAGAADGRHGDCSGLRRSSVGVDIKSGDFVTYLLVDNYNKN